MPNPINPMSTNLAASGKTLKVTTEMEFDLGLPGSSTDRQPLVNLLADAMAFDQCIPFSVNVEAGQTGYNLWKADAEALRARAVVIICRYGGGGILINPDGAPTPFPLSTQDATKPAWFCYCNPSGGGLTVGVGATGPGIDEITVDTEVESRFDGFVFV